MIIIKRVIYLKLGKDPKIYTNHQFYMTIIKIEKESELFDKFIFMDKDEDIFESEEFLMKNIRNKKAYILEYTSKKPFNSNHYEQNCSYSTKKILEEFTEDKEYLIEEGEINYNGKKIIHNIPTNNGVTGAPIISVDKFKVIGYHIGKHKYLSKRYGKLLKYPINEFIEKFYS